MVTVFLTVVAILAVLLIALRLILDYLFPPSTCLWTQASVRRWRPHAASNDHLWRDARRLRIWCDPSRQSGVWCARRM